MRRDKHIDIWEVLKEKKELGHCKECHKRIWAYWHIDLMRKDKCAPCYFKSSWASRRFKELKNDRGDDSGKYESNS